MNNDRPATVIPQLLAIFAGIICFILSIKISVTLQFKFLYNGFIIPADEMFLTSVVISVILFSLTILTYRFTMKQYRSGAIAASIRRFRDFLIQIYNHIKKQLSYGDRYRLNDKSKNLKNGDRL